MEANSPAEVPAAPTPAPVPSAAAPEGVALCTFDDFSKIQLRVAEIVAAEDHPKADKLLKLKLRVGEREKQICAGIKAFYAPEALVGRRIVIVDNLEPRKLRGEISEGMLLAAHDPASDAISLVTLDNPSFPTGGAVS